MRIIGINSVYSGYRYSCPNFKNKWKEHKSWGANIDPKTGNGSFKTFVFPDSKSVSANIFLPDGKTQTYKLENMGEGVFELKDGVPQEVMQPDYEYNFAIKKNDGDVVYVKDPYSFKQEGVYDKSVIYDHNSYIWNDTDWFKSDKARISRIADKKNGLTPLSAAKICEVHIGTASKEGDFEAAKQYVLKVKQLGFNAIELMPNEATYSFNWGYDGADKFAVSNHIGGNDGLKKFIDWCHQNHMNVIMDMVPNHIGVDMASLHNTGPYIGGRTPWGNAFNYEGKESKYVRDYIVNAAINWADNYHCDGIRFDMTKFMNSDSTMQQIAAELHYHLPDVFLIAEDARSNISVFEDNFWQNSDEIHDKRIINPLYSTDFERGLDDESHCRIIDRIRQNNFPLSKIGFDSEWDFNYFHTLNEALYGNINLDYLEKTCYCSQDKVKYVMSHDEIGNHDGSRLLCKLMVSELNLQTNLELTQDDFKRAERRAQITDQSYESQLRIVFCQKMQLSAEAIATLLQTGKLDKYKDDKKGLIDEVLSPLGIKKNADIDYQKIKDAYNTSYAKNKLAQAFTFSIPGIKMLFQGDERADLTPFRFFREFQSIKDEENLFVEKGYRTDISGFEASKLGTIEYSQDGKILINAFCMLMKDLNRINDNNTALQKGYLQYGGTTKIYPDNIIGLQAKDNDDEIFTVSNFGSNSYNADNKLKIKFPQGKWVEILNTDSKKYLGSGNVNNRENDSNGEDLSEINLSKYSVSIFKKIG